MLCWSQICLMKRERETLATGYVKRSSRYMGNWMKNNFSLLTGMYCEFIQGHEYSGRLLYFEGWHAPSGEPVQNGGIEGTAFGILEAAYLMDERREHEICYEAESFKEGSGKGDDAQQAV